MTTSTEPRMPPPLSRDAMVQDWQGVRALSAAGDRVWLIALAWTAVHIASPAAAGLVVAAGTLPRAAVLLIGGVTADRYDARRVMIVADSARIAVLAWVGVAVVAGQPGVALLVVAAAAFGVTDAFHDPAAATVGRQLVRPEDLPAYTGVGQTLSRLGSMGGAAVGGFVVARWGLGGSAALNGATFVAVVAVAALWMRPRFPLPRAPRLPVAQSLRSGFAHLRSNEDIRTLVLALTGLNLFVVPAETIGLALRTQQEGWGSASLGLFLAVLAGSAGLGSLAMVRWRPRHPVSVSFGCLVAQGLAVVALGVGGQVVVAVAAAVVGVTAGVASTLLSAVFAATVAGEYLGRMASIVRLGDDVLMPLSTVAFGALAGVTSTSAAFAAYGTAMALAMGTVLLRTRGLGAGCADEG